MKYIVIQRLKSVPDQGVDVCYLWTDGWNDWYKYRTLYELTYFDSSGKRHDLGGVKIGQFDWETDQFRPALPVEFEALDERFFSLGQEPDYYSTLMAIGPDAAGRILNALNDIAFDEELYQRALSESVTGESLLRYVNIKTIEDQYRRILDGGAELTDYRFNYVGPTPLDPEIPPIEMDFIVDPYSNPPTNIHVLIGRNGVGKTYILNSMTRALVSPATTQGKDGLFTSVDRQLEHTTGPPIANVLSISFSAFDDFELIRQKRNATAGIRYTSVGLRKRVKNKKDEWVTITRSPDELAQDFSASAKLCARGKKAERWQKALTMLEADPLFAEAEVAALVNIDEKNFGRSASQLYRRLSSGHKIVLLTITKLVENVEEKTLVLMDEPEAHLHPPLLAAFVRALSALLINRNGVAIIATHSPVVLQEVPRSCAWKIVRHGVAANSTRPTVETFAENVGVLTKEIFGLEVTRSGFHKLLVDAAKSENQILDVVSHFDTEVGSEGRALISSILASKEAGEEE